MKWEETKSWPYPVLRPNSSDYQKAAFEVSLDLRKIPQETAVEIEAEFALGDEDLLRLVEQGDAEYHLLVRCSTTHYRRDYRSTKSLIKKQFANGYLAGRVEFAPFLVAVKTLPDFRAKRWHPDYQGLNPRFDAGSVLAADRPTTYWIDTDDEAPITSVFRVAKSDVPDGQWRCRPQADHVDLEFGAHEYERFNDARSRIAAAPVAAAPEGAYLINGVYLPALIWLLVEADRGGDDSDHAEARWYHALGRALEKRGRDPLGTESADRIADAQILLEEPFARMPVLNPEQAVQ